jgi:hypothetical protein
MAGRRELAFASLDEVMPEVERLMAGHVTVGRWTLGQICNHLATVINWLQEGGPDSTLQTVSEAIRQRFFRRGRFPEGVEAPHPSLLPKPGLDARTEAEALREALDRFVSATEPFAAHPILGPLTREEWTRFHCMHCAHHLGFAIPL